MNVLALVVGSMLAAAAPWPTLAADWPEGRFVAEQDTIRLDLRPDADGALTVELVTPDDAGSLALRLEPRGEGALLQTAAATPGLMGRLLGHDTQQPPFAGGPLGIARRTGEDVVITALAVDEGGGPTLLRLRLTPEANGLRMERRRFVAAGLEIAPPVLLERMTP